MQINIGGWIFLSVSWGAILFLCVFTFLKVLRARKNIKVSLEIKTGK